MPTFISKVQHNNYEKGEFSEEKARTLEETLELVKTFPFDAERTLTEIQLTGPSVTIQDEDLNYLKVGLYFNGKLCIYYLDNSNHLYECYVLNIEAACNLVSDFFNNTLDLSKFEKHLFNIGNQAYFVTNYFEYRENRWRILLLNTILIIYGGLFVIAAFVALFKAPVLITLLICIPALLFGAIMAKIFNNALKNKNNYLQISKGNDVFFFGYDEDNVQSYSKLNIDHIVSYDRGSGSRNPNLISAYEIFFKDGSSIKLSNMLISGMALLSKFTDKMDNSNVKIIYGKQGLWKALST